MILCSDVLAGLRSLPDASVQCVVTSPPYWALRDYGVPGQIGSEPTIAEYVAKMVEVFAEVHRVLKKDGVVWLNLGDTYFGDSPTRKKASEAFSDTWDPSQTASRGGMRRSAAKQGGLKPKDRCMIPARVTIALQDWGWFLRDEIIWHKPNPMPSSVQDRTTPAHEMIYLLSKSKRYFYDAAAIRTPLTDSSILRLSQNLEEQEGTYRAAGGAKTNGAMKATGFDPRMNVAVPDHFKGSVPGRKGSDGQDRRSTKDRTLEPRPTKSGGLAPSGPDRNEREGMFGANARSVWTIATVPFTEAHFATFPPELPRRCILAGSRPGDTVLDPFAGSGTTLLVARRYGRQYIGIELNPEYVKLIKKRLADETPPLLEVPA